MSRAADVVIVGGGLVGAATALFLRRLGCSVIVLERGLVGQQASGVNFGALRRHGRPLAQLPLAARAHAIWQRLPELIDHDCECLWSGHVKVACDEEGAAALEAYAAEARDHGLGLQILDKTQLRSRFGFLSDKPIAASVSPLDGHANPRLAAPAFARAAMRIGAQVLESCAVVSTEKSGEDFRIGCVDGRVFRAPALMIAAGAWSPPIAQAFAERVPLTVAGPQMAVTEPVAYSIAPVVAVQSHRLSHSVYFRQVSRGNVVFGGGGRGYASTQTNRSSVDPQITLGQFRQLRELVPVLGRLSMIRSWSGIEGYLPDGNAVIGASRTTPGLYYAFGFSGQGFLLAPGVGEVMAQLIGRGTTAIDLEPFALDRFSHQAVTSEASAPPR